MKRVVAVCLLLIGLAFIETPSIAQPPDTLWTRHWGVNNGYDDRGEAVQQTSDGGYIIAGFTYSSESDDHDLWLIKTDSDGNEEWDKTFGGNDNDYGKSVQQTSDGGYIVTGWTFSFGAGLSDMWLVKTDSEGNEEWNRTFGGNNSDYGKVVQQTDDGGYIITGMTWSFGAGLSDVFLVKTDSDGNLEWYRAFGGLEDEYGWCVRQTTDGGYAIAGGTLSFGAGLSDVWLIKTDSQGNEEWNHTYGGVHNDYGKWIQQTEDGGFIITGYTLSGFDNKDVWLNKTDSEGNEEWTRTFGGDDNEYGKGVQQTIDGGYIITGWTLSYGAGDADVWLIKTDFAGIELWSKTIGGVSIDRGYGVEQTADGGYIITGMSQSSGDSSFDLLLIRVESDYTELSITLTPVNPPIIVPGSGGTFQYYLLVENNSTDPMTFDLWTEADLADGETISPIGLWHDITLPPEGLYHILLSQYVTLAYPAGVYTYRACVGNHPVEIIDSDEFNFEKLASTEVSQLSSWGTSDGNLSGNVEQGESIPDEYAIESIYPNPFNPTTTVSIALPSASELIVRVFNTVGQEVAMLADGQYSAGRHSLTLDARYLASGLYFVQMTVPGEASEMQKVVLMR